MFVKLFLFLTILFTLQCNGVESFEAIKNAIKHVAHKVHSFVNPNHVHTSNCKHSHDDVVISTTTTTTTTTPATIETTPYPEIDIRRGSIDGTDTVNPDDPDFIPDIGGRSIIGTSCASGFRTVNGQCRAIAG